MVPFSGVVSRGSDVIGVVVSGFVSDGGSDVVTSDAGGNVAMLRRGCYL